MRRSHPAPTLPPHKRGGYLLPKSQYRYHCISSHSIAHPHRTHRTRIAHPFAAMATTAHAHLPWPRRMRMRLGAQGKRGGGETGRDGRTGACGKMRWRGRAAGAAFGGRAYSGRGWAGERAGEQAGGWAGSRASGLVAMFGHADEGQAQVVQAKVQAPADPPYTVTHRTALL